MKIRSITKDDFDGLLALAEAMRKESPYYLDIPIDQDKLLSLGQACLDMPDKLCGFIAENGTKEIAGFFIGCCYEYYFGHDKIAQDLALYVPMTQRGGHTAIQLIKEYERWAESIGASHANLGITTGINTARTKELYSRMGFKDIGILCRKTLKGA